ncbi:MAG: hypothetical protein KKC75_06325 [Nanoarchaeota archaeon]|nr:hypothetical protein [Nanoarchaeota archaeon]MBU1946018.1 hypothetical protein [Nanoarchaeota archaeon]
MKMKKKYLIVGMFFLVLLFGINTKTTKADLGIEYPIEVRRTISDNSITLSITPDYDFINYYDVLILVETIPNGLSFVYNSFEPEPVFVSDESLTWFFAKNPPQTIGSLTVDQGIPSTITYLIQGAALDDSEFRGKWGFKLTDEEGWFVTGTDDTASSQYSYYDLNNDNAIDTTDVLIALEMWGQGYNGRTVDVMFILNMLEKLGE